MTLAAALGPCLVTGGGGFLGRELCRQLVEAGCAVASASRGTYPELAALGVEQVPVDLRDPAAVVHAVRGRGTVFHLAARTGVFGPRAAYWGPNVDGTRHVLDACRAARVPRLVHTSSPSVCFDGTDHHRASNDLPYAARFLCWYPASKAEAERLALAANGPDLATVALRPHLIVGPGDPHLVPRLEGRARAGRLAVVGDGTNEVSLTDVANAAAAHLDAAARLAESGADAACAGRAYFLGQREPVVLWEWIGRLLDDLGAPRPRRRVSRRAAYAAGAALEGVWGALRLPGEPPMTRFVAQQLALSHSYDLGPAERDLGYRERVTLAELDARLRAGTPPITPRPERGAASARSSPP